MENLSPGSGYSDAASDSTADADADSASGEEGDEPTCRAERPAYFGGGATRFPPDGSAFERGIGRAIGPHGRAEVYVLGDDEARAANAEPLQRLAAVAETSPTLDLREFHRPPALLEQLKQDRDRRHWNLPHEFLDSGGVPDVTDLVDKAEDAWRPESLRDRSARMALIAQVKDAAGWPGRPSGCYPVAIVVALPQPDGEGDPYGNRATETLAGVLKAHEDLEAPVPLIVLDSAPTLPRHQMYAAHIARTQAAPRPAFCPGGPPIYYFSDSLGVAESGPDVPAAQWRRLVWQAVARAVESDERTQIIRRYGTLTATEQAVFWLIAGGGTHNEVGALRGVMDKTIEAHQLKGRDKLGAKKKEEFGAWSAVVPGMQWMRRRLDDVFRSERFVAHYEIHCEKVARYNAALEVWKKAVKKGRDIPKPEQPELCIYRFDGSEFRD